VGRGKSFLMDAFYRCVPLVRKRRVHFHHFMREIHRELDELRGTEDPLAAVAQRTARRHRLICFDEFHVADIADAMILGRFLEQVMDRGVEFVMTSNYHPDTLYPNGLQRERLLPPFELIKQRLDVVGVDNGTEYRRLKMERLKVYHMAATRRSRRSSTGLRDVEEEKQRSTSKAAASPIASARAASSGSTLMCSGGGPRSYADYVRSREAFPHGDAHRRAAHVAQGLRCRAALHLALRRDSTTTASTSRLRRRRARDCSRRASRRPSSSARQPAARDADRRYLAPSAASKGKNMAMRLVLAMFVALAPRGACAGLSFPISGEGGALIIPSRPVARTMCGPRGRPSSLASALGQGVLIDTAAWWRHHRCQCRGEIARPMGYTLLFVSVVFR